MDANSLQAPQSRANSACEGFLLEPWEITRQKEDLENPWHMLPHPKTMVTHILRRLVVSCVDSPEPQDPETATSHIRCKV